MVHWYFRLLDKNSSGDIGKKEIKPFKRFLRKKSKPKKCVKKFVEYCDANNDKALSVQELMGCLGVAKEEGRASARRRHRKLPPAVSGRRGDPSSWLEGTGEGRGRLSVAVRTAPRGPGRVAVGRKGRRPACHGSPRRRTVQACLLPDVRGEIRDPGGGWAAPSWTWPGDKQWGHSVTLMVVSVVVAGLQPPR